MTDERSLFDFVLVVALTSEAGKYKATVAYQFPPPGSTQQQKNKKDIAAEVTQFCYPELEDTDSVELLLRSNGVNETFSFVLTDLDGSKRFGYCRRFLGKTPECYCLISFFPSFSVFSEILDIVEIRREDSKSSVYSFLKSVLAKNIPQPGETITIKTFSTKNTEPDVYRLTRCENDYEHLDYVTFDTLFRLLNVDDIIFLFESLLVERRLIIMAKTLSTLSSCANAITALTYPFTWQHIYIPILPLSLINYACAPMPFIVGLLSSSLSTLDTLPIEEVIIVDLDSGEFIAKPSFPKVLPPNAQQLKKALKSLVKIKKRGREFSLSVAQCFLRFFCEIFGDYQPYFSTGKFDREKFVASKSSDIQKFLKAFHDAQMFEMFILDRETIKHSGRNIGDYCVLLSTKHKDLDTKINNTIDVCEKCSAKLGDDRVRRNGKWMCPQCKKAGFFDKLTQAKKKIQSLHVDARRTIDARLSMHGSSEPKKRKTPKNSGRDTSFPDETANTRSTGPSLSTRSKIPDKSPNVNNKPTQPEKNNVTTAPPHRPTQPPILDQLNKTKIRPTVDRSTKPHQKSKSIMIDDIAVEYWSNGRRNRRYATSISHGSMDSLFSENSEEDIDLLSDQSPPPSPPQPKQKPLPYKPLPPTFSESAAKSKSLGNITASNIKSQGGVIKSNPLVIVGPKKVSTLRPKLFAAKKTGDVSRIKSQFEFNFDSTDMNHSPTKDDYLNVDLGSGKNAVGIIMPVEIVEETIEEITMDL